MIDVELLTLCEFASHSGGKLNIIGTFDHIVFDQMEYDYECFVAGKVIFEKEDLRSHSVHIRLNSSEGEYLIGFGEQVVYLEDSINKEYPQSLNFVAKLRGLKFTLPGLYFIELHIDNKPVRRIRLYTSWKK